ncbi:serine hydrolase domain-containing protein [Chitinophaga solisilvae]|uniref:serine hydrolase domain-containing protein n=1 Tax=Chitinophaga solisilvae TaxID=1233460 RepID=UPI001371DF03|nr:serine hydrolase domain-containing protein [Chitinophaga solisilvae]
MRRFLPVTILILLCKLPVKAQQQRIFADSIRKAYQIPALGYALVSADSIYDIQLLGEAKPQHRFRIGSNTKAITCMVAALLVQEGRLHWDMRFFDLFPEMKAAAHPAYHTVTLQQLLTFRNKLVKYTYTHAAPRVSEITGSEAIQRRKFAAWLLRQPPVTDTAAINLSNSGYTLAGMMLERAGGQDYMALVKKFGAQQHIHFGAGNPNAKDSTQLSGHHELGLPEPVRNNPKLNWLMAAGNINVSLEDYVRFIQLQLKGLKGQSLLLPRTTFEYLHYGLPFFAFGWFHEQDENGHHISHNTGNPGGFITDVYIDREADRACIIFTNIQQERTYEAIRILREKCIFSYLKNGGYVTR